MKKVGSEESLFVLCRFNSFSMVVSILHWLQGQIMSMDMNQAPAEEWWRRLEAVLAQGFSRCVLIARERAIDGTSFDFHTNKFFSQVTRVQVQFTRVTGYKSTFPKYWPTYLLWILEMTSCCWSSKSWRHVIRNLGVLFHRPVSWYPMFDIRVDSFYVKSVPFLGLHGYTTKAHMNLGGWSLISELAFSISVFWQHADSSDNNL